MDMLKSKLSKFETLQAERKKMVADNLAITDKNSDKITNKIKELGSLHEQARRTTIKELSKETMSSGISDLTERSKELLKDLKGKIEKLQFPPGNALHEAFGKIVAVFEDNIDLRTQLNDYIFGIVTQTNNKVDDAFNDMRSRKKRKSPDATKSKEDKVNQYKNPPNIK